MNTVNQCKDIYFVAQATVQQASSRVRIFDTTLRDGEQTPGVHISADQKVDIARRLEAFGVTTIEAGFPSSSPGDHEAVVRVAQAVMQCEAAMPEHEINALIEEVASKVSAVSQCSAPGAGRSHRARLFRHR